MPWCNYCSNLRQLNRKVDNYSFREVIINKTIGYNILNMLHIKTQLIVFDFICHWQLRTRIIWSISLIYWWKNAKNAGSFFSLSLFLLSVLNGHVWVCFFHRPFREQVWLSSGPLLDKIAVLFRKYWYNFENNYFVSELCLWFKCVSALSLARIPSDPTSFADNYSHC